MYSEENKEMAIKTKDYFSMTEFLIAVEDMASGYFNDDNYAPHIGILNVMKVFYNDYVLESKFDVGHNIVDALEMEPFINDKEFYEAFNDCIYKNEYNLSFGKAYNCALNIVQERLRKNSDFVNIIKTNLESLIDKISPVLTTENIDKVSKLANDISTGKLSAEAIADAVADSGIIEKIAQVN